MGQSQKIRFLNMQTFKNILKLYLMQKKLRFFQIHINRLSVMLIASIRKLVNYLLLTIKNSFYKGNCLTKGCLPISMIAK